MFSHFRFRINVYVLLFYEFCLGEELERSVSVINYSLFIDNEILILLCPVYRYYFMKI